MIYEISEGLLRNMIFSRNIDKSLNIAKRMFDAMVVSGAQLADCRGTSDRRPGGKPRTWKPTGNKSITS